MKLRQLKGHANLTPLLSLLPFLLLLGSRGVPDLLIFLLRIVLCNCATDQEPSLGLGDAILGEKITKKQGFFRSCVVPSRLVDAPAAPGLRRMRRAAPRPCSTWSSWRGWGGRRWLSAAAVVASERRRQSRRGKMAKTRSMQSTAPKTPPPPASISSRSPAISLDLGSDGIDFCN